MLRQVEKITHIIHNGVTEPLLGYIEDRAVVIKHAHNRWGKKVLANELICYGIARELGIDIPLAGVCVIDDKTNIDELQLEEEICLEDIEGLGFYSEKIIKSLEVVDIDKGLANKIINRSDIIRILLFDHIIYNTDRRDDNMMITLPSKTHGMRIYVIDHSHVFNLKNRWDISGLQKIMAEKDYNDIEIMERNITLYEIFLTTDNIMTLEAEKQFVRQKLTPDILKKAVEQVPEEWISKEEKAAILEYLEYRVNYLDNMYDMIVKFLEEKGGK